MNFKPKTCKTCGEEYLPTGRAQKFCPQCGEIAAKAVQKRGYDAYRARRGDPVGLGRGGTNKHGADHPKFVTGRGQFVKLRKQLRATQTTCERCGTDLAAATSHEWCVHHRDHNQNNNVLGNLEMLCKRCHQTEHRCWEALTKHTLEGATTIPSGSRD